MSLAGNSELSDAVNTFVTRILGSVSLTIMLTAVLVIAVMLISYGLSLVAYEKREF
jgi:hypothetical protein